MPVICLETGEQIGTVQDILCDSHLHMLGVVLQLQSLFQPGTYIPANHIYAVGDDYLTVLDSGRSLLLSSSSDRIRFCSSQASRS